jgi:hypothetical protein
MITTPTALNVGAPSTVTNVPAVMTATLAATGTLGTSVPVAAKTSIVSTYCRRTGELKYI